jgi:predicted ATP-grasp superfamily ATP-dependent carboligase
VTDGAGFDAASVLTLATGEVGDPREAVMLIGLRGWFDVAGAATDALNRIAPEGTAVTIGTIDPDPFFDFTVQRPQFTFDEEGERAVLWPVTDIRLLRMASRDLVVVVGVEPHLHWRTYAQALVSAARQLGCRAVVTVGAAADAIPHSRTPPVVGSTTDPELARRLGLTTPSYQGITGLIGTLLVDLDIVDIPAVSLRVGIPHYLATAEHPRASAALVQHLSHVLGTSFQVDFGDDIERAASVHLEMLEDDRQLQQYVIALERDFDRRTEAAIPTSDELGRQFEEFLREHGERPDDTPPDVQR